jgi:hypothetical protein
MKDKLEKWKKVRAKGKWHFVLKYGIFFLGVSTAILFILILPMVNKDVSFIMIFPVSIVLFPLGGLLWGTIMWTLSEHIYKKGKKSEQKNPGNGVPPYLI